MTYSEAGLKQIKKLAQSITTGPTLSSYKGAVVFALVMFQKLSVFTSQFQTEDQEGRKHLLPVEEVHFQKTNSDFTQLGLLCTKTVVLITEKPKVVFIEAAVFTSAIYEFHQHVGHRLNQMPRIWTNNKL